MSIFGVDTKGIGEVAKAAGDLIGKVGTGVLDRFWPKKLTEAEKAANAMEMVKLTMESDKADFSDRDSARQMYMTEMRTQKQPWIIRLFNGFIRPYGGAGALTVFFWNMVAPRFGQPRIEYSTQELAVIILIIGFYFGGRMKAKAQGVTGVG